MHVALLRLLLNREPAWQFVLRAANPQYGSTLLLLADFPFADWSVVLSVCLSAGHFLQAVLMQQLGFGMWRQQPWCTPTEGTSTRSRLSPCCRMGTSHRLQLTSQCPGQRHSRCAWRLMLLVMHVQQRDGIAVVQSVVSE